MKIIKKVAVNEFVRRQHKGTGKTYSDNLSFEDIAAHAQDQLNQGIYKEGYRDGVIIIPVTKDLIHHFICPYIKISINSLLRATMVKRRPNENPYIQIRALNGNRLQTGSAELILYRHDVLLETKEQSTNTEWELISFHAIPEGITHMPMGTVTMMRNQLQMAGGTRAIYDSEKWAESVKFWQEYAVLDENNINNDI